MKTKKLRPRHLSILLLAAALMANSARAANVIKQDTPTMQPNSTDWSATPGTTDVGEFDATISSINAGTLILGADLSIGALQFDGALNGPVVIGADGNKLTLNNAGIDLDASAANQNITINCAIGLGADQTWSVASGKTLAVGGVISGSSTFTKSGLGTLLLTNNNSCTGAAVVSGGTLQISPPAPFGAVLNGCTNVIVQNGGILSVTNRTAMLRTSLLRVQNGGTYTVQGGAPDVGYLQFDTGATLNFPGPSAGGINCDAQDGALGSYKTVVMGSVTVPASSGNGLIIRPILGGAITTQTVQFDGTGTGATISQLILQNGNTGATGTNNVIFDIADSPSAALDMTIAVLNTQGDNTRTRTITKQGAGTLQVTGAIPANGANYDLTINGGSLIFGGKAGFKTLIVNSSGILGGIGPIGGTTIVQSGGMISPGMPAGAPVDTLTFSNLTLNATSTNNFVVTPNGGASSKVAVVGLLTPNNSVIKVTSGTALDVGTNTLFTYGTCSGSFNSVPLFDVAPSGGAASIVDDGAGHINLVVTPFFYISPAGSDVTGDGTIGNPWQSMVQARDYIRSLKANTNLQADLTVYLRGGRYPLTQTLVFTPADSGTNGHYAIYRSYSNEVATISGGKAVTNWTQVAGQPYWVASVPTNAGYAGYFRQLYVNGIRAERAHSGWITGISFFDSPATTQSIDGVTFNASALKSYSNVSDLRLLHINTFKVDEFPVTGITTNGTTGLIQVALQQPYCQARYNYATGLSSLSFGANDPWMLVQAFEELDEPGEWYLNRATQQVYYYPYSYETNLNTIPIYVPGVETLVSLTGTGTSNSAKVQNIRFQNLVFEHGNWSFPRDYFIGGTQAEILYPPLATNAPPPTDYGYEVPGEIILNNTAGIQFIGNTIQHMGSCGIQPFNGTLNTLIEGNIFYDLTGAAVLGGRWGADAAIPNQQICTNTIVVNNVIRNTGGDFMASTLIDNLTHYGFQVLHNDMADAQYGGFHQRTYAVGLASSTGTGGTIVSSNRISMGNSAARYQVGDIGYIYSFGVWSNCTFQGNDLNGINYANGTCRAMMFDNNSYGSTAISNVARNVAPGSTGYLLYTALAGYLNSSIENYGDATVNNFNGVTNINFHPFDQGSLPVGAQAIVTAAGLEPGYTNLLQGMYAGVNLAQGVVTWASSPSSGIHAPGAAIDDWNFNSVWQPNANDTNQCWWAVDLGAAYAIQRIELSPNVNTNQPDARCNFQVQGADNPAFTNPTVLSEQNAVPFPYETSTNAPYLGLARSWVRYVNNPQSFRYLRVIKTATGTLAISQFQVFGYLTDTNPPVLPKTINWTGGSGTWDVNNSANTIWKDTNSTSVYYRDVDSVVFNNTVGSGGTVTLNTNVNPFGVTVANPAADYTINGNGSITGFGRLTKTGVGKLTLTTTNTYTGVTTISGGTLQIGDGAIDGSIASSYTIANNGALVFNLAGNQGDDMVISGNGTLTKAGAGTLTLTGSSTYTGTTTISAGMLQLAPPTTNSDAVLNGCTNIIVQNGGILVLTNRTPLLKTSLLWVQNGGTYTIQGGAPSVGYLQFDTGAMLNFSGPSAGGINVDAQDGVGGSYKTVVIGSVTVPANSGGGLILRPSLSATITMQTVQFDGTGSGASIFQFNLQNGFTSVGGTNNVIFDIAHSASATVDMNVAVLNTQADNAVTRRITKQGAGVMQVGGAIPSTGTNYNLIVNGGTLVFSNKASFKSVTVNVGSVTMPVGFGSSSPVSVTAMSGNTAIFAVSVVNNNTNLSCSSLTVNNAGTSSGLQFNFGVLTPSTTVAALAVSGNATFTTPPTIVITGTSLPTSMGNGYPLITWNGSGPANTNGMTLALPAYFNGSLSVVGNTLYLKISGNTLPTDKWAGGSGTWDINNSGNAIWKDNAAASTYYVDTDAVVFDNTVGSGGAVTLNTNVNPYSVTVANPAADYTISGSGAIAGIASLTKSGAGKLTLTTTNTYTGVTTINGGTLQIGNGTTDGSIASTYSIVDNGSLVFNVAGNYVNNILISGSGTLTKAGVGTMVMNTNTVLTNTYTGSTIVSGGTLQLAQPTATIKTLNNSTNYIVQNGGILAITNRVSLSMNSVLHVQNGGTLQISGSAPSFGCLQFDTGSTISFPAPSGVTGLYLYSNDGVNNSLVMGSVTLPAIANFGFIFSPQSISLTNTQTVRFDGTGSGATISQFTSQNGNTSYGGTNSIIFDITHSPSAAVDMSVTAMDTQGDATRTRTITKQGTGTMQFGTITSNSVNYALVLNGGMITFTNTANFKSVTVNGGSVMMPVGFGDSSMPVSLTSISGNTAIFAVSVVNNNTNLSCSSLTVNNAGISSALQFNFGMLTPSTNIAPLLVGNSVTFTTPPTIVITGTSLPTSVGNGYPLITWNGSGPANTNGMALALPSRVAGRLFVMGNTLYLKISGTITEPLSWAGGSGTWDINNSGNAIWKDNAAASTYYVDTDAVVFDNTVGSGGAVTLNTNVNPYSVTVANPAADYTISGSGAIAGIASLTKSGAGKLTLTTTNTYTGVTTINGGTLQIGNGTTDGSIASTYSIVDNGSLVFNVAGNYVNNILISGSGTLTKAGVGMLTLLNTNIYAGTTTISGGTLQIGNGTIDGSIQSSSNIIDNGVLIFNLAGNQTNGMVISGGGTLNKAGLGKLILLNTNTYVGTTTISGGTLQIGNGSTDGSITSSSNIVDNGSLFFNLSGNQVIGMMISGSGTLTKSGAGTLTLTNNNTCTGAAIVSGGALLLAPPTVFGTVLNNCTNFIIQNGGTMTMSNRTVISRTSLLLVQSGGTYTIQGGAPAVGSVQFDTGAILNFIGPSSAGINVYAQDGLGAANTIVLGSVTVPTNSINGLILFPYAGNAITTQTVQFDGTGTGAWISQFILQNGNTSTGGTNKVIFDIAHSPSALVDMNITVLNTQADSTRTRTITKQGAGVMQVGEAIPANGTNYNLFVSGGAMVFSNKANFKTIIVNASGTLGGLGPIGAATVQSGGMVSPGVPNALIGKLMFTNLTLNSGATAFFELNKTNSSGTNDYLVVTGAQSITASTLTVVNLGPALAVSDSFKLLNQPSSGFTTVNFPTGYTWTNRLAVDGSIQVLTVAQMLKVVVKSPSATNFSYVVVNHQLILNWPDSQGWILQTQTNNLYSGLTTNWVDVAGATSPYTNTINLANPARFYRLKY